MCVLQTGCATLVNGSRQTVGINSSPTGATVKVNGGVVGKTPWTGKIARDSKTQVSIEKPGYDGQVLVMEGETSGWVFGNIFTCGLFGTTTDCVSGGAYQYSPGSYHVALDKTGETSETRNPTQRRDAGIKRFVLANYGNIHRQISDQPQRGRNAPPPESPEHLRTLRGMMGMDALSDQAFKDTLRPAAETQTTADGFAEAILLMLDPVGEAP